MAGYNQGSTYTGGYDNYKEYIAELMEKAARESSTFDSEVEDPNSEVVKQTTEDSNGTKLTIENKTNNPKWRGENNELKLSSGKEKEAGNNTNNSSVFDVDESGFKKVVMPNDTVVKSSGVDELTSPETDAFWEQEIEDEWDSRWNTYRKKNGHVNLLPTDELFKDMLADDNYYEVLEDDGSSTFIPNAEADLSKSWEDDLAIPKSNTETEEAVLTEQQAIDRNNSLAFFTELEKFDTREQHAMLSGTVGEWIKENPTDAALLGISIIPVGGPILSSSIMVGGKIIGTVANVTKNSKWGKKIYDMLFRKDKFLEGSKEALKSTQRKLALAREAKRKAKEVLRRAEQALKNTKAKPGSKAFQDLQRAVEKAKTNFLTHGKTIKKLQSNIKSFKPNKVYSPEKITAGVALGTLGIKSLFDDEPEDKTNTSKSSEEFIEENRKDELDSFSEALANLRKDKESSTIADAVQNDSNVAKQVLDNQRRIQDEYGMELAKDLFTVAVGALSGFSPMEILGAKGDELILDQAHDRAMELQGFKDSKAMARDKVKADAKRDKELRTTHQSNRDSTESKMMDIIKQGGKSGGNLDSLSSEVLGALMKADELKIDFGDKGVQRALVKATQQAVEKGGWFDSEDEESARANITGHFLGNMAILSTQGGSLSKDGYALKDAQAVNNAAYTNWLFSKHSKAEIKAVSTAKLNEWKEIRKTKGEQWIWYNNFTGWAVQNLKQTGQM